MSFQSRRTVLCHISPMKDPMHYLEHDLNAFHVIVYRPFLFLFSHGKKKNRPWLASVLVFTRSSYVVCHLGVMDVKVSWNTCM